MYGIATVITMPTVACAAVANAMVLLRTRVAETSQNKTYATGPIEMSKKKFQRI